MKTTTKKPVRWMLDVVGRTKGYIALLAVVQTVLGVSVIGYALFLRGLVDSAVAKDLSGFRRYAVLLVCLVLFLVGLRALKRHVLEQSRSTMENKLKANLFHHVLTKEFGPVTATHSAQWMNRLTNDTRVVADGLSEVLPDLCEMAARLVAAVVALVVLQPWFAAVLLPGGVLLIVLSYLFRNRLKQLHKVIQERDGDLRVFWQERLSSQMVLRVFGKEAQTEVEEAAYLDAHRDARMKRNRFSNLCNSGFGLLMNGAYVFGAVYCGLGILYGTMTYGTFTAVLQLVSQVQTPFANFSRAFPQYFAMVASAERLMEVEELAEDGGAEPSVGALAGTASESLGVTPFSAGAKGEELATASTGATAPTFAAFGLRDVNFAYEEGLPVLSHFSVEVPRGTVCAFHGPSGCGKSTAMKLFLGLYELQAGEAYVTGLESGGKLPLSAATRSLFAYVPQGNALIRGTVREIVAFGDPAAMTDDAHIWAALRTACAEDFVRGLEQGLDAPLGEQGAGLSEGQMQRLSIARAVFADRPVLLLDEATSALDAATEARLLQNLGALPDKTIVIVTHRPAALQVADQVVEF